MMLRMQRQHERCTFQTLSGCLIVFPSIQMERLLLCTIVRPHPVLRWGLSLLMLLKENISNIYDSIMVLRLWLGERVMSR